MKKRISKIMRSGFAVLLSVAMIAGAAVAPAYAAPDRERPTKEEVEADIKELADTLKEYADEYCDEKYYVEAYAKAKEEGCIDKLLEALDLAYEGLGKLDATELVQYEVSEELAEKLNAAIPAAKETVLALKALVAEADQLDQATVDKALALVAALEQNLADLYDIFVQASRDAEGPAKEAYAEALRILEEEVKPVVIEAINEFVEAVNEFVEAAKEYAINKLEEAYDAFVEAVVAAAGKYVPELDAFLYDWFYNNPDKVVGFFNEYGDEIGTVLADNAEVIFTVLSFVATEFGPEVLEYVLNNPEETLQAMVNWYNKYGDRTLAMIKVYLDYLGVTNPENIKVAIAALESVLEGLNGQLEDVLNGYVDGLNAQVQAQINALKAQITAIEEQIAKLQAELNAKLEALENAVGEVKAEIEAQIAAIEAQIAAIEAQIAAIEAKIAALLAEITFVEYEVTEDSYYVSIGGSYANGTGVDLTYADKVAAALGLTEDQYVQLTKDGLRAEDLLYILNENYVADAYAKATIKNVAAMREDFVSEIAKADLITLAIGSDNLTAFVSAQLEALMAGEELAMDWARYTEDAALVEAGLAELNVYFAELGLGEYAPLLVKVVESYAYGLVGYAANYVPAINAVRAINADAKLVIVGMYNAIDDLAITLEDGTVVALGEYVDYFVNLADAQALAYALVTENTAFANIQNTEAFVDGAELELLDYVNVLLAYDSMLPTEDGHTYIMNQILNVITGKDYIKGDVNEDGVVNLADSMLFDRYLAGWDVEINLRAADINEDGTATLADVMTLDRYLAGWTATL